MAAKRLAALPTTGRASVSRARRAPQATKVHKAKPGPAGSKSVDSRYDPAVIEFLRELKHPLKSAIQSVRQIILGTSPDIREGIKWNSPSFRTADWFATLNLRAKDGKERVWLILHAGAKAKGVMMESKIADPAGIVEWLAKDRGLVTFADATDVKAKRVALQRVIREWIGQL